MNVPTPTEPAPHFWWCDLFLRHHHPGVRCSCPPSMLAEAVEKERLIKLAASMPAGEAK